MDPASTMLLFVLFQAAEKAIGYAGGKIADSMGKPIFDAMEEKAKWLSGTDETAKRWKAFVQAFDDTKKKLKSIKRHPELAKQIVGLLEKFDLKTLPDNQWLDELAIQLERASLVTEKPDLYLLVELFSRVLPQPLSRADLSETLYDFISLFQDALFAQPAYKEEMFKNIQWQKLREPRYDTRERYIEQVIDHNENLDFVGIPELKDRQALRIEDVFISLQTQVEEFNFSDMRASENWQEKIEEELEQRNILAHLSEFKPQITRRLPINQALTENQKIVILGDPGSGKTTLLKYIVLAYAENKADKLGLNESRLPIFIRLYDYVTKREVCGKDGFSFTDYLNKYCTDHLQLHLPPDFFQQALDNGECCVCFDGLDELGTAGLRREITQAVSAMASRYPRNRYIVTSRIVGYDEAPLDKKEFTHHTVQPLSNDDIKLFIEKWYLAREKDAVVRRERTEHLTKTVMAELRIKSLASNPLMLTIIALVHRIEAELPHERVKLYDKCVTTLVETWDKVRGLKTPLRRRLLEKLAYWMHSQPGEKGRTREVREGNLMLQLKKNLEEDPKLQLDEEEINEEVKNFILLVKTRSGLLVERGENIYNFSHLTFQEYLAACDIEKRLAHNTDAIWEEIRSKLHDLHWREVILLLLGSLNRFEEHNTDLVGRIYQSSDVYEFLLHRHLFLSAQALTDHVEVTSNLRNAIVDDLLKLAVMNEFISNEVFDALGFLQDDIYIKSALLKFASDEKVAAYVRHSAVETLGKLGQENEEVLKVVLALASDEKVVANVRRLVVERLGILEQENEEVFKVVLGFASDEKVASNQRLAAVEMLGKLGQGNEEVLKVVLALASDEKVTTNVRRSAVETLGKLGQGNEEVLKVVLALASDEKVVANVRLAAVETLGKLGQGNEEVLKVVLALASDNYVRLTVVQTLGKLGQENEEVLKVVLALVSDGKAAATERLTAVETLGKLGQGNEEVLKVVLGFVHDEKVTANERLTAVQTLGKLGQGNEEVLKVVLGFVRDEKIDAYVRRSAVQTLGKLEQDNEEVLKVVLALASDEKVAVNARLAAVEMLGKLGQGNKEVLKVVLGFVRDEKVDAYVRLTAVETLGKLGQGNEEVLKVVLALASDEKVVANVRLAVVETLGKLGQGNEEVLKVVLALASDEKVVANVRRSAVEALGKLGQGNEEVLKVVLGLVSDAYVRLTAVEALGKLGQGNEEVLKVVLAIASDEKVEANVHRAAVAMLGKLGQGNEEVLKVVLAIASDEKVAANERRSAMQTLKQLLV